LAARLGCALLSVDSIERGLRNAGFGDDQPVGLAAYGVAQSLASDQLDLGNVVIADAVNVHPEARAAWMELARAAGTSLVVVEVVCSDPDVQRQRLETRLDDVPPVDWEQVERLRADYVSWPLDTITVDMAGPDPVDLQPLVDAIESVSVSGSGRSPS